MVSTFALALPRTALAELIPRIASTVARYAHQPSCGFGRAKQASRASELPCPVAGSCRGRIKPQHLVCLSHGEAERNFPSHHARLLPSSPFPTMVLCIGNPDAPRPHKTVVLAYLCNFRNGVPENCTLASGVHVGMTQVSVWGSVWRRAGKKPNSWVFPSPVRCQKRFTNQLASLRRQLQPGRYGVVTPRHFILLEFQPENHR